MQNDFKPVRLNGDIGITNVANVDENVSIIYNCLSSCIAVLNNHAGPYSKYSMIIKQDGGFAEFTRDGITILENMTFMSPLETYIKNLLVHVGKLVDASANDNTTTSMLMSAYYLQGSIDGGVRPCQYGDERISPNDIKTAFNNVIDKVVNNLSKFKYTKIEDWAAIIKTKHPEYSDSKAKNAAVGALAYAQAMSSSGGNHKLALALKDIFERCPDVCREYMTYKGTRIETKEEFIVEENDYDIRLTCTANLPATMSFNNAIGTEYTNNATVILAHDTISDNSLCESDILNFLDETSEPVVIIATKFSRALIERATASNLQKRSVTLWMYIPSLVNGGQQFVGELNMARVTAKTPSARTSEFIAVENVDVKYADGTITLNNFYPAPREDTSVHPYYLQYTTTAEKKKQLLSENVLEYGRMLDEITRILNLYRKGRKLDCTSENLYVTLLEKLTSYHKPTLHLGGSSYTAIANQSVVKDAMGAIMSSLRDGINPNGLVSLIQAFGELDEADCGLENRIAITLRDAAVKVYQVVAGTSDCTMLNDIKNNVMSGDMTEDPIRQLLEDENIEAGNRLTDYPVVQPLKAVSEMFARMSDLLVKFNCTSEMIVDNSFMLKD